ncbi:hypothetical protein M8J75_012665 [Diaphorina citri]|nr:hypothetical protein M8J75_012665 [Diaphorina citri]
MAVFRNYYNRLLNTPLDLDEYREECRTIRAIGFNNGFTSQEMRKIFNSTRRHRMNQLVYSTKPVEPPSIYVKLPFISNLENRLLPTLNKYKFLQKTARIQPYLNEPRTDYVVSKKNLKLSPQPNRANTNPAANTNPITIEVSFLTTTHYTVIFVQPYLNEPRTDHVVFKKNLKLSPQSNRTNTNQQPTQTNSQHNSNSQHKQQSNSESSEFLGEHR